MPPCPLLNCSGFLFCTGVYMEYDKPFKTYDEQIIKLRDEYGLIINDCNFATHALISMSYYDLVNGYKSVLMDSGKFKDNLPIEYLYELHLLDKSIQSFVMKYSLFVENMFKNLLAYSIASSFGVNHTKYLDAKNYQPFSAGVSFTNNVLHEIMPLLTDPNRYKMPTKHYIEKHNHVPPWILFKNISFGDAINLFSLLNRKEKEPITNLLFDNNTTIEYSQKVDIIRNGVEYIRSLRNLAAHNLHFVQFRSDKSIQPKQIYKVLPYLIYLTSDLKQPLNIDKIACKGLYAAMLIMLLFLKTPYLKSLFITDFRNAIFNNLTDEQNQLRKELFADYCKLTALPINILDRLDKFQRSL